MKVMTRSATLACTAPSAKYPDGRTGTNAGYYAHTGAGEAVCDGCRAAHNHRQSERRAWRRDDGPRVGVPSACCVAPTNRFPDGRTGTRAGYLAHYYLNEEPCAACVRGNAATVAAEKAADPEVSLKRNLRYKYQLSVEDYREILERQGGRCAICRADAPTDIRTDRFHVDHDHACCPGTRSCGKCTRGLLCHACNTALGNFKDDPEILRAALRYLSDSRVRESRG